MAGLGAVGRDCEPLRPRRRQLDRPADTPRRDRDQRRPRGHRPLRAERPAQKAAHDPHVFRAHSKLFGETVLEPVDELARLEHGELAVAPGAGGGEELHRIVMLGWRPVFRVDFDRRGAEGALGVAERRVLVLLVDVGDRLGFGSRRIRAWRSGPPRHSGPRSRARLRLRPRTSPRQRARRSARRARSSAN